MGDRRAHRTHSPAVQTPGRAAMSVVHVRTACPAAGRRSLPVVDRIGPVMTGKPATVGRAAPVGLIVTIRMFTTRGTSSTAPGCPGA